MACCPLMPHWWTTYEETMLLARLVTDLHELAQAEAGQLTLLLAPRNGAAERRSTRP